MQEMATSSKSLNLRFLPGIIAATIINSACLAGGNDIFWNNISGGDFGTPLNWLPEMVPGEFDNAIFDIDELYTVTFSQALTLNNSAVVDGDSVTFDLSGFTYIVNEFSIGGQPKEVGQLTIVDGHLSSVNGQARIGNDGVLIVSSTGLVSIFGDLLVGDTGVGALTVQPGGILFSTNAYIGDAAGSEGTVLVTGPSTQWNLSENLTVANIGAGELSITDGGSVTVQGLVKVSDHGDVLNATGSISVTGIGSSFISNGGFSLGNDRSGWLSISNGGSAEHHGGLTSIGNNKSGHVSINGSGSSWICSSELLVGNDRYGSMSLYSGASVTTSTVRLGDKTGSNGQANITGKGSLWSDDNEIVVGNFGTCYATVSTGATVSSNATTIGHEPGSYGVISINGNGSKWIAASTLINGNFGVAVLIMFNNGYAQANSYIQNSASKLDVRIGSDYVTSISITGSAQIAGLLSVSLATGYPPTLGEQFTILSANSISGTFDQIEADWNLEVSYEPNAVIVTVTDVINCEFDLEGDGVVGISDLLLLFEQWGTNPGGPPDFNGDGIVSTEDLLIMLANWGPCE